MNDRLVIPPHLWPLDKDGYPILSPLGRSAPDPSNPKDATGSAKLPLTLVPTIALAHEALALLEGDEKYGLVNWRGTNVRASVYLDAAERHTQKWKEGEECDPATGIHHLGYARACYAIILDAQCHGSMIDDRPVQNRGVVAELERLTALVPKIKALFADKHPKRWTRA